MYPNHNYGLIIIIIIIIEHLLVVLGAIESGAIIL